ncbi:molybdopterin cofactor-binding domain-containing protein [Thermaurantiacus sp.]
MLQRSPAEPAPTRRRFLPSRRQFLIGTGAALGLAIGWLAWPRRYADPDLAGEGETMLNAWVRVAPDGQVILAIPQAEMGQGAVSGLAQILADEMGAAWETVSVEPAPLHPAYAQLGLVKAATASLPPLVKGLAAYAGAEVVKRLNIHLTGGSTSIMGYHDIVRQAGAAARAMLAASAARTWGVDRREVDARDGVLVHGVKRLAFAEAVRSVDPADAEGAELRPEGERRLVGQALPRIDLPPKVDGSARFGGDVRLPGMLFAAIRHGPVGNGRLLAARAPAGVRMVKGANWVAALGATTFEAMRALERVEAEFATDGRAAGPWIEAATKAALNGAGGEAVSESGDVAAALGPAPVAADYFVPHLAHACLEPMVATARVADGHVELWGPTQSQTLAVMMVARALGVEPEAITVYPTFLGGGFGRRAEADHFVEAALIAKAAGRPVQLQFSREEDLQKDYFRPAAAARMRGRVVDGRIAAFEAVIGVPSVGHSAMQRFLPRFAPSEDRPNAGAIEGAAHIPYAAGAFRAVHVPVETVVPLGFWRSVGHSFSAFFVESFIDELAAAAGEDPVAFRLKHLADRPRHAAVLRAVAADAGFDAPAGDGFAKGVALHESFGSIVGMVVEAGVKDGAVVVRRVWSVIDCGRVINPDSVVAQVEGAAIMGLNAALAGRVSFADGYAEQRNFDSYPLMRLAEAPRMATRILAPGGALGGVGEPGTPPAAPALANALFRATGVRARVLPLGAAFA